MTATPPANGYFNYTIPSTQSQPVGRFIPADFNLVSGDIVPACNAFSYMGQPFGVMLDVLARNTTGVQTRNYTGPLPRAKPISQLPMIRMGNSLSSRLRNLQPLQWLNGRAERTLPVAASLCASLARNRMVPTSLCCLVCKART